jgi:UDP-2,3-diacylglucosamine hydrolase
MSLEIRDGALFVADAHENGKNRTLFGKLLQDIKDGKVTTTQLFLMGDMFDLLVGGAGKTEHLFKNEINILEEMGKKIDIFYFEGNHDFNLAEFFTTVKVVPIDKQPLLFESSCGTFKLAHGDLDSGFWYTIYTKIIRNPFVVAFLDLFDWDGNISGRILRRLEKKELCTKIDNFEEIATEKILLHQNCDFIVEGHYHQDEIFTSDSRAYINLGAFACSGAIYQFDSQSKPHFKEFIYKKE